MVWLLKLTNNVYPSGADLATAAAARLPPAPGRFSISTGCFSAAAIGSAMARAIVSVVPPAGAPPHSLIGRAGYSWAWAPGAVGNERMPTAMRRKNADFTRQDLSWISVPPLHIVGRAQSTPVFR